MRSFTEIVLVLLALLLIVQVSQTMLAIEFSTIVAETDPFGVGNISLTVYYTFSGCACLSSGHLSMTSSRVRAYVPNNAARVEVKMCVRDVMPGYEFDHWERNGVPVSNELCYEEAFKQVESVHYRAVLRRTASTSQSKEIRNITAENPIYRLRVNWIGKGKTYPKAGNHLYENGSKVCFRVTYVEKGYIFDHWEVNGGIITESRFCLLIDRNYHVIAYFREVGSPMEYVSGFKSSYPWFRRVVVVPT